MKMRSKKMTVRELIEELESVYDKNMRVAFCSDGEEYEPIYQIDVVTLNSGQEVCQLG